MFFDLETTGVNILEDRIVEICVVKLFPDGHNEVKTRRINPGRPIPAAATAVHHITDEDVANEPSFREIAKSLYSYMEDCDIAGFNSNKFDIPLLIEEFGRVGINFQLNDREIIDVQNIFYKKEPRTLTAAYKFYCGGDLENAHSADADTLATMEVLLGQLERYEDLQADVKSLGEFSRMNKNVDLAGRFIYNDENEAVVNFGKHKGKLLREVLQREPSYFHWMMNGEFSKNTKDVLRGLKFEIENGK